MAIRFCFVSRVFLLLRSPRFISFVVVVVALIIFRYVEMGRRRALEIEMTENMTILERAFVQLERRS